MKNFDLTSMGVHEMNPVEMQVTDGGIIWLIVAAAVVLVGASSCTSNVNIQIGGQNNTMTNTVSTDSSFNGAQVDSTFNGNVLDPGFVPIQK